MAAGRRAGAGVRARVTNDGAVYSAPAIPCECRAQSAQCNKITLERGGGLNSKL